MTGQKQQMSKNFNKMCLDGFFKCIGEVCDRLTSSSQAYKSPLLTAISVRAELWPSITAGLTGLLSAK